MLKELKDRKEQKESRKSPDTWAEVAAVEYLDGDRRRVG
jgi:hypothetical protein